MHKAHPDLRQTCVGNANIGRCQMIRYNWFLNVTPSPNFSQSFRSTADGLDARCLSNFTSSTTATRGKAFNHLKYPVTRVHFVAHKHRQRARLPRRTANQPFFTVSDNPFVHVGVVQNVPGQPGIVITESKQCAVTAESAYVVSANVLVGVMAEGLFGIIVNRKYDNYTLAPIREGCRYWVLIISKDLVEDGVILREVSDAVTNTLAPPSRTPPTPRPMARGSFRA